DEGSLAFLPLAEAEQVRAQLLARRDARRRARSPQVEPPSSVEPVETTPLVELVETTEPPPLVEPVETTEPEVVVGTLDPVLLVMSILLSTETAAFVVSALLVGGAVFLLGGGLAALGGAAGVITLVAGFAISAFRRLSSFYGFTLTRTSVGLQVRRGLLERTTQTFVLRRVQGVVVTEPWAWRLLGWARLDVAVARRVDNDGGGGDGAASTVMPVAPRAQVMALAALLLTASAGVEGEPVDPDAVPLGAPPDRARWVAPVRRRWLLGGADDHAVVSRHGLLTRRTHAVAYARLQSAHLRQSPWQRPLRLVDLVVDSPPGPVDVRLRHRDGAEARLLLERTMDRAREARVTADLGG
ncbi:MAG: PH domain-containing protein, partial [Nocardioidaceae bacterium]